MMHKSLILVAGLLSFVPDGTWWQSAGASSPDPSHSAPGITHLPPRTLQENLPNNQSFRFPADTTDRLSEQLFRHPPADAKPWVLWYWMQAGVSKEGITADLEAMKQAGIGGAYLATIKDTASPPLYNPPARQLTPEWWGMVRHAMEEAKRLQLKLALHISDGFALAGGPWITPELSMQKLVWSREYVKGGEEINMALPDPPSHADYYKDIAVLAYPANSTQAFSDTVLIPRVTTSVPGAKAQFLAFESGGKESFKSDSLCWIQYKYPQPFTCRSIKIHTGSNNYQAHRLLVQVSDDGEHFTTVTRLEPPRHGWQDTDEDVTHAIPAVTAPYYRFVYDKTGSEAGAEDLDAAKWKPALKVAGIYLSDEPVLNQYESKNGSMWRVSRKTTAEQAPDSVCVPLKEVKDLTNLLSGGRLKWQAPPGNWVIVRIGHTSTGHTNATGGAGKGLECDKFNPAAIRLQLDKWYGEAVRVAGPGLAKEVLTFYVDSWECGSQNWSSVFLEAFKKRRGYDLRPYLLAMTGTPLENAAVSEGFLYDVRQTIASLIADNFYGTLKALAQEKGIRFSAESVAPTMMSDGMLHYQYVDLPMGEFWLNSPTHDKPNDMLDAVSGAHVYGKRIIGAESFTTLRMDWSEHPGMLKVLGDRNFALGANKLALHVFTHNPWMDRQPGMTLDGIGLYFQRDQTWWKPGKAWFDYLQRCQALLQLGRPVADVAVFTGEELPRRSVLPHRLVGTLPGIIGKERVEREKQRLDNKGTPLRTLPMGVTHSANMADPEDWIDPLRGYAYDAINPDALLRLATVKNKRIVLPGGASYGVLVIPAADALNPARQYMSAAVEQKIAQLVKAGATVILAELPTQSPSLQDRLEKKTLKGIAVKGAKGQLLTGVYADTSFAGLGLARDLSFSDRHGKPVTGLAWTHRSGKDFDLYFISNQADTFFLGDVSVNIAGKQPEWWDPVNGDISQASSWENRDGRTVLSLVLSPGESQFLVFRHKAAGGGTITQRIVDEEVKALNGPWQVKFDTASGGPAQPVVMSELSSWTLQADTNLHYYSGTATYTTTFQSADDTNAGKTRLMIDSVYNIARVKVNGVDCGTLWTAPYQLDIRKALRKGSNELVIEVTNTWANRLIGDQRQPAEKRRTWTNAPFRLQNKPLLPAGLVGKVYIN